MTPNDGYECFRELAETLSCFGFLHECEQIQNAMKTGATGAECLGQLGEVLIGLRKVRENLPPVLSPSIASCIRAVQLAWPHYN